MSKTDQHLLRRATAKCVRHELQTIGDVVNVWRMHGEDDRRLAFRIAFALQASICEREQLLELVLSLSRFHETSNHGD